MTARLMPQTGNLSSIAGLTVGFCYQFATFKTVKIEKVQ